MSSHAHRPAALLVLADGTRFEGEAAGAIAAPHPDGSHPVAVGEVVFNTSLSGYQEIITDPSYAGQLLCFTYPHIGNYGVTDADNEARQPFSRGIIVRDLTERPSNWRSEESLEAFLIRHDLPAITGIDTRRLTRHLRSSGALPGAFAALEGPGAVEEDVITRVAASTPGTDGIDLVATVTTPTPYTVGTGPRRVVAYDFGIKTSILRQLGEVATVEVVPASTPAADVLARRPDGVFLSNGPGDPAPVTYAIEAIAGLIGQVPIFGICLGHQLLGAAMGAETYKLPFGHHGANHPVGPVGGGHVEITSQNHNYAVAPAPGAEITHTNLNDGVVEGLAVPGERAFSVQFHPEAGPGPHDARHLFGQFAELMQNGGAR